MDNDILIERIETERLVLRKATDEDLLPIYNNVWKDKSIAEWMMWKPTESFFEAVDRLNRTIKFQKDHNAYFVALKDTNEPIGLAAFVRKQASNTYEEAGICISSKYQGNGYGLEVLQAMIETTFEKLDAEGFGYAFFAGNEKSKKLCLHFPFKKLETKTNIRSWDEKEIVTDYYYLDKKDYLASK